MSGTYPQDPNELMKKAVIELRELRTELDALKQARREPIAVIGLGCRFPGAPNPEAFWRLLAEGVDAIGEVPSERWDVDAYYDPEPGVPGKTYTRCGGFIGALDGFDAGFFGIAPREAVSMDPQQRLLLEVSWEALEHAGLAPERLVGSPTGVFVGICSNDYHDWLLRRHPEQIDAYLATGTAHSTSVGRLSYTLGLQGPSVAVDTACSSSLVAVQLAVASLRNGECKLALVGGVNVLLRPELFINFCQARMLSPTGRCKTFDAAADGYVRAEGCGVVVLKRLTEALHDGNNVLAVIRGSAVNQDGRTSGLTVPNGPAQQAVIRAALENGHVKPAEVRYVEAHGTGTSLGDPIEVGALGAVFGERKEPLLIGSVKTNIGHLEAAAGMAGLIRIVLALRYGEIPPSLHFHRPNPHIPWAELAVAVAVERRGWPAGKRVAGVSSFGFGGTNAHVVLEEAPIPELAQVEVERPLHLLTLSGKTEEALKQLAVRYADSLAANPSMALADLCFSANTGRSHFNHRLSVVAWSVTQARKQLRAFIAGQEPTGVFKGQVLSTNKPKLAFLFTGQGSQYIGMGRQLYETQPSFRQVLDHCDEILRPYLERNLVEVLYPKSGETSPLDETAYTQPALFALEYALAQLWRSWGIEPSVVMGHSVGEYVAACVAGVFSLEEGLKLIAERGRLMQNLPEEGEMVVVFADEAQVTAAIQPYAREVSIAALNGPQNTVISGRREAVEAVVAALHANGVKTRKLAVSHAFHSALMESMRVAFEQVASEVTYSPPPIGLISNVTGELAAPAEIMSSEYWCRHIRQPVRFAASMESMHRLGVEVFLEIGPKPTLLEMGQHCLPEGAGVWLSSLRQGQSDWQPLLWSLGELYRRGVQVNWSGFDQDYARRRIALPTYPWQRSRYWMESPTSIPTSHAPTGAHPLLGRKLDLVETADRHYFDNVLSEDRPGFISQHRVFGAPVLPAAAMAEWVSAAAAAVHGIQNTGWLLEEIVFKKAMILRDHAFVETQTIVDSTHNRRFRVRCFGRLSEGSRKNWQEHCSAVVSPLEKEEIAVERLKLADLTQIGSEYPLEGYYERLSKIGLDYGTVFRGLKRLWRREQEALAWIECPLPENEGCYLLHPVSLDACFHALASFDIEVTDQHALMPVGVRRMTVRGRLPHKLWCRATWRGSIGTGRYQADLSLFNEAGEALVFIEGLQITEVPRSAIAHADPVEPVEAFGCYDVEWVPQAAAQNTQPMVSPLRSSQVQWLVFAGSSEQARKWQAQVEARGDVAVAVYPGAAFPRMGPVSFEVDARVGGDWGKLFEALRADRIEISGLIVDGSSLVSSQDGAVVDSTYRVAETAFHLLQHFLRSCAANRPEIVVCTRGAFSFGEPRDSSVFMSPGDLAQSALTGIAKAVIAEYPQLKCVQVDMDPAAHNDSFEAVLNAAASLGGAGDIAARGGRWYAARLRKRPLRELVNSSLTLQPDGTYLITGGLRGIGLAVAEWLVGQGARSLLLLGRTIPTDCAQALASMRAAGARVDTLAIDVADAAEVERALSHIAKYMRPLRGVIHSAGITDDATLEQLNWPRFCNVMSAKVRGAWNLHLATINADLDFFVLFSSIASLIGSPGQANYVVANAFLDALAHYRRQHGLKALSINWGVWSQIGIAARRNLVEELAARGVKGMDTQLGLQALTSLLSTDAAQVGVFNVDWDRFKVAVPREDTYTLLSAVYAAVEADRSSADALTEPARALREQIGTLTPDEAKTQILDYLFHVLARTVELNASKQAELKPIFKHLRVNELGVDSLMAVQLRNRILPELNVDIPIPMFIGGSKVADIADVIYRQSVLSRLANHAATEVGASGIETEEFVL